MRNKYYKCMEMKTIWFVFINNNIIMIIIISIIIIVFMILLLLILLLICIVSGNTVRGMGWMMD